MSKRRKIETQDSDSRVKTLPNKDDFRCKLKDFLGKKYESFKIKEHENIYENDLSSEQIQNILKRQSANFLRKFFKSYFDSDTKLSKRVLINIIVESWDGNFVDLDRKRESENIDEEYISTTVQFFCLNGVTIPRDIMLEILKFLHYDYSLIKGVGCVNSSIYLLLLTSWENIVPISVDSIFKISSLVLKSMKKILIGPGLDVCEFEYLLGKSTPSRIREIYFHPKIEVDSISKFFNSLKSKNLILISCTSIHFPPLFHIKKNKKKQLTIPSTAFPRLRFVDNLQINNMDISQLSSVDKLVIGSPFPFTRGLHDKNLKTDEIFLFSDTFSLKDMIPKKNFKMFPSLHFTHKQRSIKHAKIIKTHFSTRLPNSIKSLKFRMRSVSEYSNFCSVIESLHDSLEKVEMTVSTFSKGEISKGTSPGDFILPILNNVQELVIVQKELYLKNWKTNFLLFHKNLKFSFLHPVMKKVRFHNVPISICVSSLDCFPNLENFSVEFTDDHYITWIPSTKYAQFEDFVGKFVDSEIPSKKFFWCAYLLFVLRDNRTVKMHLMDRIFSKSMGASKMYKYEAKMKCLVESLDKKYFGEDSTFLKEKIRYTNPGKFNPRYNVRSQF